MPDAQTVETADHENVRIVRFVDDEIVDADRTIELGSALMNMVKEGEPTFLLLNFENVTFFSTGMMGELVKLNNRVRKKGGTVALCCMSTFLNEMFHIARLDRVFEIFDTEKEAIDGH